MLGTFAILINPEYSRLQRPYSNGFEIGKIFIYNKAESIYLQTLKPSIMSSGKVLASVLAGAAAGAILGILFAPDKGTETRRKISEKGSELAGSVKDRVNEYADAISEKYDAAREKISGVAAEGRDMLNQARDKGNAMKADIRTNSMNS